MGLQRTLKAICKIELANSYGRIVDGSIEIEVMDHDHKEIIKYYVPTSLVKEWNNLFRKKLFFTITILLIIQRKRTCMEKLSIMTSDFSKLWNGGLY